MPSEFDQYVGSYKDIINQRAAITGERFEDFIELRVRLFDADRIAVGSPAPRAILDFGCGIGATAEILRRRFPGARLQGVDSSLESIRAAESLQVPEATFCLSEGASLPFADRAFDLIYSNGTFHHIDHALHPAILRELARVLSPGGLLYVFENNPFNPVMMHGMRTNPFDAGTKTLRPRYLQRLVRDSGLTAERPRFYYFFPKALRALRWTEPYLRRVPVGAQYYVRGRKDGASNSSP
jgi:ubiquinone/menaquinone biosynthesis C-methylase UbiE